jgi:membrane protease YdiL (CAAX protease family)
MTEVDHLLAGGLVLLSIMLSFGSAPEAADLEWRWRFYRQGWLAGLGLVIITLAAWHAAGRPMENFGLCGWVGPRQHLTAIAALLWTLFVVLTLVAVRGGFFKQYLEPIYCKYVALMPTSRKELVGSWGTAVAAGTGEEIAFRGFLLWYVATSTDDYIALLATSVLFGIAHGYQKIFGMIFALSAGLMLGTAYLASGSLLLVAWMHASWNIASFTIGSMVLRATSKPRNIQSPIA